MPLVKPVKILKEKPPIFDAACNTFGFNLIDKIFTYGDTIYNPSGHELPDHVIEHEKVHIKQQGDKPELWWGKFLRDQEFRIDQEARAYAKQYVFLCDRFGDRNKRAKILYDFAAVLSGKLYGECIGHFEAMQEIKKFTGGI